MFQGSRGFSSFAMLLSFLSIMPVTGEPRPKSVWKRFASKIAELIGLFIVLTRQPLRPRSVFLDGCLAIIEDRLIARVALGSHFNAPILGFKCGLARYLPNININIAT